MIYLIYKKGGKKMMNYNSYENMMGDSAGIFMWLTYILVVSVLILSAVALWKYINK